MEVLDEHARTDDGWRTDPPTVTAVLVLHDGARWVPAALEALRALQHRPDELVVVDVGSRDASPDLVTQALPGQPVINAPAGAGFGAAVDLALERARSCDWVWLLHDDCAPAPDALARLLDEATAADDVAVVGPKVREWPSLRRLLEVGVTLTGTGHRETGLERGEPDQGQHDRARDVLAVGSAGMLVRRSAWERLGGFDAGLPRYGDDLDFGWRANRAGLRVRVAPRAVVFHVEAASRSLRPDGLPGTPLREQRRAALFTLLANASTAGFAWQSVRLVAGSLLRVLALLVAKAPGEARDELLALVAVYRRPATMFAARRSRAASATVPAAGIRRLLPSPAQPYQHGLDSLIDVATAFWRPAPAESSGRRASAPGRRVQEAVPEVADRPRRAWPALVVLLVIGALAAARGLIGPGSLTGGALLAAPDSAGAWWSLLLSEARAPAYVLALAAPATLVWGHPGLVVEVLLLGAVPLAALTAHRLGVRLLGPGPIAVWWSLTWAVGVAATGAVAQGRIGTVVALVLAPVVAGAGLRLLDDPGWQSAVRLGAWLGLATAFAPVSWLLAVPVVLVAALARPATRRWGVLAVAVVVPLLVAWPRGWAEAGAAAGPGGLDRAVLDPDVLELLVGRGSGPGDAPWWLGLGVVLGGLVALARTDRRPAVLTSWAVGLLALAVAVAGAGSTWVGLPAAVWAGSLALATALAADGWRHRVVPVVAALCVLGTVATAGWWVVRGADDPLRRGPAVDVPAYLADRAEAGVATLVVEGDRETGMGYTVVRGDGPRLGDEALPAGASRDGVPRDVVRDLVTDPTAQVLARLAAGGVGAIYLDAPADPALVGDLEALDGLAPSGAPDEGSRVWTLEAEVEPAVVAPPAWSVALAWLHLVVVVVVVLLALPGRRGRRR